LASASGDKAIKVWDALTGQELLAFNAHTGWVESVAFSPDGKRLARASSDKTVGVWDALTGHELLTLNHTRRVDCARFVLGHRLAPQRPRFFPEKLKRISRRVKKGPILDSSRAH